MASRWGCTRASKRRDFEGLKGKIAKAVVYLRGFMPAAQSISSRRADAFAEFPI
jgi:hypothetical protein